MRSRSIAALSLRAPGCVLLLMPAVLAAQPPPLMGGFPTSTADDIVRFSGIALADVDGNGSIDIVVSGSDGVVHAYNGSGSALSGWPFDAGAETNGMGIEGKAAIADVDANGDMEVIIGAGSTFTPNGDGRLFVLDHQGNKVCHFDPGIGPTPGRRGGIYSSPAVADLDGNDNGQLEIVFGSFDHKIRAIHHDCSPFWEVDALDTVFSSPAIGDLDRNGDLEVVIGADSHFEPMPLDIDRGGRLHILNHDGSLFLDPPLQIDEVITSSPSLADLDDDGFLDVVFGTGICWAAGPPCGDITIPNAGERIYAVDRFGVNLTGWPRATPGEYPAGSPALADLDEDGELEVVINTVERADNGFGGKDGWVYVLNGDATSVPGWPKKPSTPTDCSGGTVGFSTAGSPIVADITGDGHLEVILHSGGELVVWDKDGGQISRVALQPAGCVPTNPAHFVLGANLNLSGPSPGVADIDGDNDLEVIVGGAAQFPPSTFALFAWDFAASTSAEQPWPVFGGSADNVSRASPKIFSDGFESGNTSAWTMP